MICKEILAKYYGNQKAVELENVKRKGEAVGGGEAASLEKFTFKEFFVKILVEYKLIL